MKTLLLAAGEGTRLRPLLRDGRSLVARPNSALVIDFGSRERPERAKHAVRSGALDQPKVAVPC